MTSCVFLLLFVTLVNSSDLRNSHSLKDRLILQIERSIEVVDHFWIFYKDETWPDEPTETIDMAFNESKDCKGIIPESIPCLDEIFVGANAFQKEESTQQLHQQLKKGRQKSDKTSRQWSMGSPSMSSSSSDSKNKRPKPLNEERIHERRKKDQLNKKAINRVKIGTDEDEPREEAPNQDNLSDKFLPIKQQSQALPNSSHQEPGPEERVSTLNISNNTLKDDNLSNLKNSAKEILPIHRSAVISKIEKTKEINSEKKIIDSMKESTIQPLAIMHSHQPKDDRLIQSEVKVQPSDGKKILNSGPPIQKASEDHSGKVGSGQKKKKKNKRKKLNLQLKKDRNSKKKNRKAILQVLSKYLDSLILYNVLLDHMFLDESLNDHRFSFIKGYSFISKELHDVIKRLKKYINRRGHRGHSLKKIQIVPYVEVSKKLREMRGLVFLLQSRKALIGLSSLLTKDLSYV